MQICRSKFVMKEYGDELRQLFKEHWDEVGMVTAPKELGVDINEDYYTHIAENNMYLSLMLKTDEGKLIGYLSIFIYGHPHHQSTNFAVVDCFIIKKGYRNVSGFKSIIKMFKMAEEILIKEFNVHYFQFVYNINNPLDSLGVRLGFEESDVVMVKKLGR